MPQAAIQDEIAIGLAREADAPGIHALMRANIAENGGSLTANFSLEQIVAILGATPCILARREGEVLGFLLTASREAGAAIPVLQAMFEAYAGAEDAYVYGPICVAAALRGRRLAEAMFAELKRCLPGREGVLFVRRDNAASLRAHRRMGMREVAEFSFQDSAHVVFTYVGEALD